MRQSLGIYLLVSLFLLLGCTAAKVGEPRLSQILSFRDGRKVWVYDDILSVIDLKIMGDYLVSTFVKREDTHKTYNMSDPSADWNEGETRLKATLNKNDIESFKTWKSAKSLIENTLQEKIILEHAEGEFLHALEYKKPMNGWHCAQNRYVATIFLNRFWQYNNYGQLSLMTWREGKNSTAGPQLVTVHSVHPKPARMVVRPSCLPYLAHPPTVNFNSFLTSLNVLFTTNKTLEDNFDAIVPVSGNSVDLGNGRKRSLRDFKFTNPDADRHIDYGSHLKKSFFDKSQKGIYVFDDLYSPDELRHIRRELLKKGNFLVTMFDGGSAEDGDNVVGLSMFDVSAFLKTPLWKRVYDLVCHVSNEYNWAPYDVALNQIHSADHTRIHDDSQREYEYTYLLYLNEGTGPNEFGETVFFERSEKDDGILKFTDPGGEEYEPLAAVMPKFGRVVIFRNTIEHSARPFSTNHFGSRFSFAVKVSRSRRFSFIKQLYEAMENLDLTEKERTLSYMLQEGSFDDETSSKYSTDDIERGLKNIQGRVEKYSAENHKLRMAGLRGEL